MARGLPRRSWLLLAAVVVLGVVGVATKAAAPEHSALQVALGALVGVMFALCGLIVVARDTQRGRTGTLMLLVALAWFAEDLVLSEVDFLYNLSAFTATASAPVLVHLALAFPSGRVMDRAGRAVVGGAYAVGFGLGPLYELTGRVPVDDCGCRANAFSFAYDADVGAVFKDLIGAAAVVVAVATLALLVRRQLRATAAARRVLAPFNVAAVGLAAAVLLDQGIGSIVGELKSDVDLAARDVSLVALAALPIGFLAGLLRIQFDRVAVADLAIRGDRRLTREETELALQRLLRILACGSLER